MKKSFFIFAALMLLLLNTSLSAAFMVRMADGRITIEAEQVPLQTLLKELAYLGIRIRTGPDLNPKITASIQNEDIQIGLSKILKSVNHVLIWETANSDSKSVLRLAEIQIYKPGEKSSMKPILENKNFSIDRNPANGSLFVKDEILIRLRPEKDISALNELLKKINGTLVEKNASTGIYRIRLPKNSDVWALRGQIGNHPDVMGAEPNFAYPLFSPALSSAPWRKSRQTPPGTVDKSAVPVAVLDSGYTTVSGLDDYIQNKYNALDPEEPAVDSVGHGTQMALIASGLIKPIGVPPDSGDYIPVLPIKVFDENGYTSNFSILQSIDFAYENGARILSLSWGSETRSEFLEDALDLADSQGLIVIASAGNQPTGKPVYPAAYDSVVGTGALTPNGKLWENTNRGDFVTLYAPGFGILPVGYKGDPGVYAGTSIAAAFTANIIADYLSKHPDASKKDVLNALKENK